MEGIFHVERERGDPRDRAVIRFEKGSPASIRVFVDANSLPEPFFSVVRPSLEAKLKRKIKFSDDLKVHYFHMKCASFCVLFAK